MRKGLIAALVIAALALTSCQSTGTPIESMVTVSGSATVKLTADIASFTVSVEETMESTSQAQEAANEKMNAVASIPQDEYGVRDEDITTTGMSLYPEYYYQDGQQIITGQTASQSINVKIYSLENIAPIVDRLSSVSGIRLSSISLDASDKSQALSEARKLAVADAVKRAEDYAGSAGLTLGNAVSIQEAGSSVAVNRVQPKYLTAAAADAEMASSATYYQGDLSVSADVDVSFLMY